MSTPIFVCPPEPSLLERLRGRTVSVSSTSPQELDNAVADCGRSMVSIASIRYAPGAVLAEAPLRETWKGLPLAVLVPAAGPFRQLRPRLAELVALNVRVHFLDSSADNLASARVLASLGIAVVVPVDGTVTEWELMTDLATYAFSERSRHAAIDPFTWLGAAYRPTEWTDLGRVYFDAPGAYLHVDHAGRAALTSVDLGAGRFVAEDAVAFVDSGAWADRVRPLALHAERFAAMTPCSTCAGWRVCLGRFGPCEGCSGFAAELMEMTEQHQERGRKQTKLWQH